MNETLSLGKLLAQGGWAMIPIYICSIATLAVFIHKAIELKTARLRDVGWFGGVLDKVRDGQFEAAAKSCADTPHPAARVVAAVSHVLKVKPNRAEAEAKRTGSLELQRLEKNLAVLSFLAQVAPLLGLLGTVLGMVDLFMGLQGASRATLSVAALSSGIWKALLTTAAGLSVAMPALAAHTYLASRTDRFRLQLGDLVEQVITAAPVAAQSKGGDSDGV